MFFIISLLTKLSCSSPEQPPLDLGPAPEILDINIHTAKTSGGGEAILSGKNFLSGATVTFGNKAAPMVEVLSSTQIKLIIPQNDYAQGPSVITVTHPDNKSSSNDKIFSYIASQIGFQLRENSFIQAPYNPTGVVLANLDQDRKLDIAFTNAASPNCTQLSCDSLGVIYSDPFKTLLPPKYYAAGQSPEDLVTADFNNDGLADIATLNTLGNELSILINKGNKNFESPKNYGPGKQSLLAFTQADIDSDGYTDIIAIDNSGNAQGFAYFGDGTGSLSAQTLLFKSSLSPPIFSIVVADFNGDKKNDIAVASITKEQLSIFFNQGNRQFSKEEIYPVDPIHTMIPTDFNNDGIMDLLFATIKNGKQSIGSMRGVMDTGKFKLSAPVFFSVIDSYSTPKNYPLAELKLGDFDQDGLIDLAVTNGYGRSVNVYSSDRQGNFRLTSVSQISWQPRSLVVGDVDGDGAQDIVIGNFDYAGGGIDKPSIAVLYNHSK